MSLTNEQLIKEAKEYHKFTEITYEIKKRFINIYRHVWATNNSYGDMHYNYPAIQDSLGSLVNENYKRVVHSIEVDNSDYDKITVSLVFAYDNCQRGFTLSEYDFTHDDEGEVICRT